MGSAPKMHSVSIDTFVFHALCIFHDGISLDLCNTLEYKGPVSE